MSVTLLLHNFRWFSFSMLVFILLYIQIYALEPKSSRQAKNSRCLHYNLTLLRLNESQQVFRADLTDNSVLPLLITPIMQVDKGRLRPRDNGSHSNPVKSNIFRLLPQIPNKIINSKQCLVEVSTY